jgi:hypothetical protein
LFGDGVPRPKYQIEVKLDTTSGSQHHESLFNYGPSDLCLMRVWPAIWGHDLPEDGREIQRPGEEQLLPVSRWFKIPKGYYRVIKGFIREIDLLYDDRVKDRHCVFRAIYLLKILDHFVGG